MTQRLIGVPRKLRLSHLVYVRLIVFVLPFGTICSRRSTLINAVFFWIPEFGALRLNNWTPFYFFFCDRSLRVRSFHSLEHQALRLNFPASEPLIGFKTWPSLTFLLSERFACTSCKHKCSYLKHCHGDLRVSFSSAQKLCCEINGEVKHLFSEFRICGDFSFGSIIVLFADC